VVIGIAVILLSVIAIIASSGGVEGEELSGEDAESLAGAWSLVFYLVHLLVNAGDNILVTVFVLEFLKDGLIASIVWLIPSALLLEVAR